MSPTTGPTGRSRHRPSSRPSSRPIHWRWTRRRSHQRTPLTTLPTTLPAGERTLTARTEGGETRLDAVMVQPLVTRVVLGGDGHGTALLRSAATKTQHQSVTVPGRGKADVWSYDGHGALVSHHSVAAGSVPVSVAPGGFTLVRR